MPLRHRAGPIFFIMLMVLPLDCGFCQSHHSANMIRAKMNSRLKKLSEIFCFLWLSGCCEQSQLSPLVPCSRRAELTTACICTFQQQSAESWGRKNIYIWGFHIMGVEEHRLALLWLSYLPKFSYFGDIHCNILPILLLWLCYFHLTFYCFGV